MFFCKEMKWGGGGFFVKKWAFPLQIETKLTLDLFFILHFTYLGGVRTHPTHPAAYGPGFLLDKGRAAVARVAAAKCRSIVERRQC